MSVRVMGEQCLVQVVVKEEMKDEMITFFKESNLPEGVSGLGRLAKR